MESYTWWGENQENKRDLPIVLSSKAEKVRVDLLTLRRRGGRLYNLVEEATSSECKSKKNSVAICLPDGVSLEAFIGLVYEAPLEEVVSSLQNVATYLGWANMYNLEWLKKVDTECSAVHLFESAVSPGHMGI